MNNMKNNQSGMVAIIVTTIIMAIITLIIVGFATISRREQRQALDDQLSTQAFYAAETGVNWSRSMNRGQCDDNNPPVELGNNVSVTCVLFDGDGVDYIDLDIVPDHSEIRSINTNENIHKLIVNWQVSNIYAGSDRGSSAVPVFPNFMDWNSEIGIVRADIIPAGGSLSRQLLIDNVQTVYLYPSSNSSDSNSLNAESGIYSGKCTPSRTPTKLLQCSSEIYLKNPGTLNSYKIRLKGIYRGSYVAIQAYGPSASTPLNIIKSQIEIDSTGKVGDVLRRIKVRYASESSIIGSYPEFVLESMEDICKRYVVYSGGGSDQCLDSGP